MDDCPTPDKRAYKSKAKANQKWQHGRPPAGTKRQRLYPYLCPCGDWHLTRQTPEEQAEIGQRIAASAPRKETATNG